MAGKEGSLLLEVVLALAVLSSVGLGALQVLSSEGSAARQRADRAVALCAAGNLLEEMKVSGAPSDGTHVRASWAAENGLRQGRARVVVDRQAPAVLGLAHVRAEILWTGPDRKPRRLSLESLVEDRP